MREEGDSGERLLKTGSIPLLIVTPAEKQVSIGDKEEGKEEELVCIGTRAEGELKGVYSEQVAEGRKYEHVFNATCAIKFVIKRGWEWLKCSGGSVCNAQCDIYI